MSKNDLMQNPFWVRSDTGVIFGVCRGLGESTGLGGPLLRALFLVMFFIFGTGLLIYLSLAWCLPKRSKIESAYQKRILGVCYRLGVKSDLEVPFVRFLFFFSLFLSLGATIFIYLGLHFILDPLEA